ncbi:mevalonate kinase [Candidatus Roizmanbacteria bacterium RIFCSPLOWO2_01_FULL_35_13]|uniref:Mevalonate kinase n=1 Tax=Candidatus Roizmanbacteria bacterium RIFCSPLOWO2_01_FULL_35_13 TaxID=1802055 RepID=A0A1F7IH07_9BACT|nr:MAG: mevalonate kinase [Candidatus Roizmanbacteria bacterium RIFCSPLOWO2_01_FULL_35_13]
MKIKTSAPGKLMLMGEHAVVYGYPCIVTAVDKRLYVEAEIFNKKEDEIVTPQVKESRFVLETLAYFRERFKIHRHIKITTKGDFSHNVGLGSSSAVTVATFSALSSLFNLNLTKKEIFDLSYTVTLKIQGVGSGFDIAAATYGGTLYFVKGGKIIEPLEINSIPLVVGYSGIKADTPYYVRKVAEAFKDRKSEMVTIFIQIADLVNKAKKSLTEKDYLTLGKLMTNDQSFLKKLGVSITQLDEMIKSALDSGAYGAKLSGAGGGDCMIALVAEEKRSVVEKAIKKVGGEIINVKNNAEGVRIEK